MAFLELVTLNMVSKYWKKVIKPTYDDAVRSKTGLEYGLLVLFVGVLAVVLFPIYVIKMAL